MGRTKDQRYLEAGEVFACSGAVVTSPGGPLPLLQSARGMLGQIVLEDWCRGGRIQFKDRDLHLVKKALAIAVLAIARQPGPFQSASDQSDMKALLDQLIDGDVELEHYARIAVTGKTD